MLIFLYIVLSDFLGCVFSDLDVSDFIKIALVEAVREVEFKLFGDVLEKLIQLVSDSLDDEYSCFLVSFVVLKDSTDVVSKPWKLALQSVFMTVQLLLIFLSTDFGSRRNG